MCGNWGRANRVSTSYVKLRYPQLLNMESAVEKLFIIPANGSGKAHLVISSPSSGVSLHDVTDPANVMAIGSTSATDLNAVIEAPDMRIIYASTTFLSPAIKPVVFRQIIPSQHDYIIITHPLLRKSAMGYSDPVEAYAAYRASPEGGSYDTLVVNTPQLFDQFNYGEPSPLAIFHFMRFLTNVKTPKYLLLAGKGLDVDNKFYRLPASSFPVYKDFVPSAGYPASDMVYTAGMAGTTYEPAVPTGRITAIKPEDVASYLNKVKEMEALPFDALWRKDLVHLSGGIYPGEPEQFKLYMEAFEAVAEDHFLGGKVSALAKHSKEIQLINIAEQVNNGLNMINFFGHASPTLLDFELGYVTDDVQGYHNKGKYPTLLMNGCQVGAFFLPYTLFGEDWLVAKDRGAIGFIAHTGFGFTNTLRQYTETFYDVGYHDLNYVTKGLGDIQKETAKRYMLNADPTISNITQVQQMILLGDPAVRLFGATKADLEINDNHVGFHAFNGEPISIQTDSFAVTMIVRNFGLALSDTVRIEILRTLNDNTTVSYDSLFPVTRYSDTLTFIIRKGKTKGFGNNAFRITIDPDDIIQEYSKENNVTTKTLFIALNGTRNLYPAEFAIVNTEQVSLSLQSTDLLTDERDYLLELDTTQTFDSPYKRTWTIKGIVLARQPVDLLTSDTLAYYWRTKLAQPLPGESEAWTESSFTYIKGGAEGWAQVQFPQYLQNESEGLVKDPALRRLKFSESIQPVSVATFGSHYPDYYQRMSIKISGVEYFASFPGFNCRTNTLNLIAFDRKSTVPYLGIKLEWFNRAGRTCGRDPLVINSYVYNEMATGSDTDLIAYVDAIETGDSIVLFTIGEAYYSLWPVEAKVKLGEFGISEAQMNDLQDDEPVVIFGRKGDVPGSALIYRADALPKNQQEVTVNKTITGGYSSGSMGSGLIGPAIAWDSLYVRPKEIGSTDITRFNIAGVNLDGKEEIIYEDIDSDQDLGAIDATEFPYLRISFKATDETFLTASQLDKWLVTFTPGPEGLLFYQGVRDVESVNEGLPWAGSYGFVNISDKPFSDSLTVKYEVFNQSKLTATPGQLRVKAPLPGDTTDIPVIVNTIGKSGLNDIAVFVNPKVLPEQYYDNNLLQLTGHIDVTGDGLDPVLDVSIDGRHLENGDYVSPNPYILVKVWDENTNVLKADTAGVRLFLTYPCGAAECDPTPVPLTGENIEWYAATDTSAFKVIFTPANLEDGAYRLRVEGADAAGNRSGLNPYEISFEVRNETTIGISDPHPNPFNREVFFDVVLTGGVLPDYFDMQLVNVNGQVQDHFSIQDFPAFHIGTNQLIWDGRSSTGNVLPNGVYVYKITITVGGAQVQRIGKLVLLR